MSYYVPNQQNWIYVPVGYTLVPINAVDHPLTHNTHSESRSRSRSRSCDYSSCSYGSWSRDHSRTHSPRSTRSGSRTVVLGGKNQEPATVGIELGKGATPTALMNQRLHVLLRTAMLPILCVILKIGCDLLNNASRNLNNSSKK
ncbi:unnamed protein product [Caenorhabditis auriculariae]|uniref:Uncharacterized protein n=1 Tax=Caenorhabditis auriculariae TaxID=2777116 RepID=A0A8S1GZ91_9PELO|nr:unnamed protein product [Caenorhabditis auriculariae]